jgi:hypothetical protein
MSDVWAVVFGDLAADEVRLAALYDNKDAAEQHAGSLAAGWRADKCTVRSAYVAPPTRPLGEVMQAQVDELHARSQP